MPSIAGKIHSIETFGTLDGPGVRLVVFLHGCPLRCIYCHNADMVYGKKYETYTPVKLFKKIEPFIDYFKTSGGGVTLSGGDPVLQPDFVKEFLKICKSNNIHTCIDTSLFTAKRVLDELIPYADLWLISLKHFNNEKHLKLTGVGNAQILENIKYLSDKKCRIWFRYLVLPGWTDTFWNLRSLFKFLPTINFELIELLPYHTFGVYKWEKLGLKYALPKVKPPSAKKIMKIKRKLEKRGFKVQ